ncbi:Uncharacterized protein FWK35_00035566 [Aphis craccivora]|uniref:Uncharacterized protein n=1 Tax=Aphis craccivora TaxID=307492 RepID=A0A6G0VKB8_APHCR|nr:Uncharacterized protein FWK35_00035566 [Aphis craccivora]
MVWAGDVIKAGRKRRQYTIFKRIKYRYTNHHLTDSLTKHGRKTVRGAMATSGRLDPAIGVGQRRRCPTDSSTGGEDVHRAAAAGSGAGGNLPARVGRQGGSIQRTLQQQPQPSTYRPQSTQPPSRPQRLRPRHSPTGQPQHQAAASSASRPIFVAPRAPAPAPKVSGETPPPPARERTEAQQARNRKKFQQLRNKKRAREQSASQNHRLAKQPAPDSSPEAACSGPSIPPPVETMKVDEPAPKSVKLEEMEQPNQTADSPDTAEDDWLAAPGLPLEEYPETVYDNRFYTPYKVQASQRPVCNFINRQHGRRRYDSVDSPTNVPKARRDGKTGRAERVPAAGDRPLLR